MYIFSCRNLLKGIYFFVYDLTYPWFVFTCYTSCGNLYSPQTVTPVVVTKNIFFPELNSKQRTATLTQFGDAGGRHGHDVRAQDRVGVVVDFGSGGIVFEGDYLSVHHFRVRRCVSDGIVIRLCPAAFTVGNCHHENKKNKQENNENKRSTSR